MYETKEVCFIFFESVSQDTDHIYLLVNSCSIYSY